MAPQKGEMNEEQLSVLIDLCSGKMGQGAFVTRSDEGVQDVAAEVGRLLKQSLRNRDAAGVEDALMLGFSFAFPSDIVTLANELVLQDWHTRHEPLVGMLQDHHSPASVPILRKAISMKPVLAYLGYDDYGAYYKKCLWALQAIGTPEAIAVIRECAASEDAALRGQAKHRLDRIAESFRFSPNT